MHQGFSVRPLQQGYFRLGNTWLTLCCYAWWGGGGGRWLVARPQGPLLHCAVYWCGFREASLGLL